VPGEVMIAGAAVALASTVLLEWLVRLAFS
jgi:hypothetical protein